MSNPFYTPTGNPMPGADGLSAPIRAEFIEIAQGFDLLPSLVGNAGKVVIVGATENDLTISPVAFPGPAGPYLSLAGGTVVGDITVGGSIVVDRIEVGSPTGGVPGAGTINAGQVLVNNVAVLTGNQTVTLSGDVSGAGATSIAATVAKINGQPLAATTPTAANLLIANGSSWASQSMSGDAAIGATGIVTFPSITAGGTIGGAGSLISTLVLNNKGQVTGAIGTIAPGSTAGAGIAINSGTISTIENTNAQTGTTFTAGTVDASVLTTFANAAAVAIAVPQAGVAFPNKQWSDYLNLGPGLATFTPTTSTINGQTSWVLQPYQSMRLTSDGSNYAAETGTALYTLANNAISTRIPNNAAFGGNARGSGAVDIQPYGVAGQGATNVASGPQAVAVGSRLTASGTQSVAMGYLSSATGTADYAAGSNASASGGAATAVGSQATAAGSGVAAGNQAVAAGLAVAAGFQANAAGTNSNAVGRSVNVSGSNSSGLGNSLTLTATTQSFAVGDNLSDRGNIGAWLTGAFGRNFQDERYVFVNTTSLAVAVRLTTDASGAAAGNVASLGNNSSMVFTAEFILRDQTTKECVTYSQGLSLITRGTAAATTAVSSGNPTMVAGPATGSPPSLAVIPAITADTTNGGFNVSYTPPIGNTDTMHASCRIRPLYQF